MRGLLVLSVLLWLPWTELHGGENRTSFDLTAIAGDALSEDAAVSSAAIARLRDAGPAGRDALLERRRDLLAAMEAGQVDLTSPDAARLVAALDAVCAQRDCISSRLFWYTDLEQAKTAAREQKKPILSLRLLGKLTDEFSCANSRFFRTALYANREISQYLEDRFVLHWQSVRPVPRVTIDFGDGRKLERTLTGNSIHYILDAQGRPVDALPGLYGPQAFLKQLQAAESAAVSIADLLDDERHAALVKYHTDALESIRTAWLADLRQLQIVLPGDGRRDVGKELMRKPAQDGPGADAGVRAPEAEAARERPAAALAAKVAVPKSRIEMPILARIQAGQVTAEALATATTEDVWEQLAALHAADAMLDEGSISVIQRQNFTAVEAMRLASTKSLAESPLLRMVGNFQRSMAIDSVRNEYDLHRRIHAWLREDPAADADALNKRVYAELFLTPDSDPWLGLVDPDTYTALEHGGVRK